MFGSDVNLRFVDASEIEEDFDTDYYLYVRDNKRDLYYYEKGYIDKSKKIDWQLFDNSNDKKYKDSDGRKRIIIDILGKTELIYDTDLNNWGEAPISIKKDKFFTESEDKFHKYHTKLSNIVKPPYFIDLKRLGIDFKDWKPILSILFDRDIILDGVSKTLIRILDTETGKEIYGEWVYEDGWVFNNHITGEYKNTLPN
jgi:hypothetical protein